jgi:hypothetical protein
MNAAFQIAKTPTPTLTPTMHRVLQRQCACGDSARTDEDDDARKTLRVQRFAATDAALDAVPPIVYDVLNAPGAPLDAETRAFMEPRLGHNFSQAPAHALRPLPIPARLTVGAPRDGFEQEAERIAQRVLNQSSAPHAAAFDLSQVRIHTDEQAAESARAVNALAYTVGRDIVFDTGRFAPATIEGRRLLAHELTHVAQQSGGKSSGVQRSFAGCQSLITDPRTAVGLVAGTVAHRMITADFNQRVAGARSVIIPGASAGPLRSAGICGGDEVKVKPQVVGGAAGAGKPDLARITAGGILQVAEIKPAAIPCLVDGEEQELRYIEQGNARDAAQVAWRQSLGIKVVAPMLESTYSPPTLQVGIPGGASAELTAAWCTPGLLAYAVRVNVTPPPPITVPVPELARATLLLLIGAGLAAALRNQFKKLIPGLGAATAAAALIAFLQGKKLAFGKGEDPLEAVFDASAKSGSPMPDDIKDAIRKDPALAELVKNVATGKVNATDAQRQLSEQVIRTIIQNRDKFTDADLKKLAELANQSKGTSKPVTVAELRRELDAAKAAAKGNEPSVIMDPSSLPASAKKSEPLSGVSADVRKRLAADPAASEIVEELATSEGLKVDDKFVQALLKILRDAKPPLTKKEAAEFVSDYRFSKRDPITRDDLLAQIRKRIAARQRAEPDQPGAVPGDEPTFSGGDPSKTAPTTTLPVDPNVMTEAMKKVERVVAEKKAAKAAREKLKKVKSDDWAEGQNKLLPVRIAPKLKIVEGTALPTMWVIGKKHGRLWAAIVSPIAVRRVQGATVETWTVRTAPVNVYDAGGNIVGELPAGEVNVQVLRKP